MDYLKNWVDDVIKRAPFIFKGKFIVKGEHKHHPGAHLEYAAIEASIENNDKLEVVFSDSVKKLNTEDRTLVDSAIQGMFDVLVVSKPYPVLNVKIEIISADIHPIDSNKIAFRIAGRNAAREFISKL